MINLFENEGSMILGFSLVFGYSILFLLSPEYLLYELSQVDKLIQSGIIGFVLVMSIKIVRESTGYNEYNWLDSTDNETLETVIVLTLLTGILATGKIFTLHII